MFDGNLYFLQNIIFSKKKIIINGFNNKYSLRFGSKYFSLTLQGVIFDKNKNFIIGKRLNNNDENKIEFLPSGGLQKFSTINYV